jgi:alkanesulfonate monooxygenase SsuD/methylene tetrahydromethanopterin reductase-like flavin-dependent oxidoreductase (luciferase family)
VNTEVKFGLSLPNRAVLFGTPPAELFRAAETADRSQLFDSVWVGDNFTSKPRLEAIVLLSALATRTERLKLGTVCMATFTLRHPIEVAVQWSSLDLLSNGRTILAVCNGVPPSAGPRYARELAAFRVASKERPGRVEEGIAILRKLWEADGPVSHSGRFHEFEDIELLPKPANSRPPILLALNPHDAPSPSVRERMLRRVARFADGWQTDGLPASAFASAWSGIRELAHEEGRADAVTSACLHLMVNIQSDPAAARREALDFLARYYGEGGVTDEKLAEWVAAGPPEAVIDRIHEFVQAGCNTPILRFASPDQRGQLERCLEDVLPAFDGMRVPAEVGA